MKKLITATLVLIAAGLYAGDKPVVYCECVGIGLPEKKLPELTPQNSGASAQPVKYPQATFNQHLLFNIQILWLYYQGIYKFDSK